MVKFLVQPNQAVITGVLAHQLPAPFVPLILDLQSANITDLHNAEKTEYGFPHGQHFSTQSHKVFTFFE